MKITFSDEAADGDAYLALVAAIRDLKLTVRLASKHKDESRITGIIESVRPNGVTIVEYIDNDGSSVVVPWECIYSIKVM